MSTPRSSKTEKRLDGPAGRLLALVIAACALALMIWLGRNDVPVIRGLVGASADKTQSGSANASNPALAACLDQRLGDVATMRRDKLISDEQFDLFSARARAYCETQFPPQ